MLPQIKERCSSYRKFSAVWRRCQPKLKGWRRSGVAYLWDSSAVKTDHNAAELLIAMLDVKVDLWHVSINHLYDIFFFDSPCG
jgi:hypothetical protein